MVRGAVPKPPKLKAAVERPFSFSASPGLLAGPQIRVFRRCRSGRQRSYIEKNLRHAAKASPCSVRWSKLTAGSVAAVALQTLLSDIGARKIDVVVVYKVDR